jgi:uncharacterized protein (DUF427 family)
MITPHHQPNTIKGAIHNPADPHHSMIVQPVHHRVQVFVDGTRVADTDSALRVIETGGRMYEPRHLPTNHGFKCTVSHVSQ